jgi:hypothetical protein
VRHARIAGACALAVAAAGPSTARAFVVQSRADGTPIRWGPPRIEFRIGHSDVPGFQNPDPALDDAIRAAFTAWEDVECSDLDFTEGLAIEDPSGWEHPEDRYVLVYFIADQVDAEDAFYAPAGDRPSARVWYVFDYDDGPILAASVYLNAWDYQWSTAAEGEAGKIDVQSAVTALVGRVLGLRSVETCATTFVEAVPPGDVTRRTLERDDVDGASWLYPAGCEVVDPEESCESPGRPGVACPSTPERPCADDEAPDGDAGAAGGDAGPLVPAIPDAATAGVDATVPGADAGPAPRVTYGCCSTAGGGRGGEGAVGLAALFALVLRIRSGRSRRRP